MARSYAVTRSAYVALRFTRVGDDVMFQMFLDDNHNGVRTLDIASQVDRAIGVPIRLSEMFPGVVIGISTDVGTDPVRIGSTNLLSFTPLGTATPGPSTFEAATACSSPSKSPAPRAHPDSCATCLAHASGSLPSDALWVGSTSWRRVHGGLGRRVRTPSGGEDGYSCAVLAAAVDEHGCICLREEFVYACGRILSRLPAMLGTHYPSGTLSKIIRFAVGPRRHRADVRHFASDWARSVRKHRLESSLT